ncbi:MAG TPA: protein kinase, partial [Micromonosporaceae bacterium]|nr:protein kinase [Micromonosporaceae bacterium]
PDGKVVLVDFGVARSATVTSVTALHEVVGTALYMAPEQVRNQALTPATDIYALGATAYHCLAGRPPFAGDSAVEIALRHLDAEPPPLPPEVPEPVQALVRRALAKDPADRFPDATAFAEAAEAAKLAGAPGVDPARPVGAEPAQPDAEQLRTGQVRAEQLRAGQPPPDLRRRRPRHLLAAAAGLLGLVVLAVLLRPAGYEPTVPDRDRPSAGPTASADAGFGPGGVPVAPVPPPGSGGTGSPQATPASSSGPSEQAPSPPGAPEPSASLPPADTSTPDPNGEPTKAPTAGPEDGP